ncbi:YihY family inner membrane protein [Alcaligenaceae bacterium CGII-47]|nr:YihY family inner membrane protein [Alcaligenaceae bacterium CGII-47]
MTAQLTPLQPPDPVTPTPSVRRAHALDMLRFALNYAGEKKLTQIAASLTFTTVLALVPTLAVVLALFTAFPLFAEFHQALEAFLSESLLPAAVSETIMLYLNQFAAQASGLTALGSAFLVVTSIMLIMTIDTAFNEIWYVEKQRPMRQRLLVYWAIITLGPVLTGASLWASSMLARESMGYIGDLSLGLGLLLSVTPLVVTALGFSALFVFVPNCRVLWRDALLGGTGTALILGAMKAGFTWYLTEFPSYTVIYGAFATLPIFLLWIYLSWLVVLMGAMAASLLPALRHQRWAINRRPGARLIDAVNILYALWRARSSEPLGRSADFLEKHLRIHPDELRRTLQILKEQGYIVNAQDTDAWVMACDPIQARLGPIIDTLLIDRNQAGLKPALLQALSTSLPGPSSTLEDLFQQSLPENGSMMHNTDNTSPSGEGP